jgi:nucleoporin NDC1
VHAALISLLVALGNAFWLGSNRDLFWSWFPFGPAGIKALLFFLSSLLIFTLQIATLRIGKQTTTSPLATFRTSFLSAETPQTVILYLMSGWWFTEAYIWSAPDLGWITKGAHNTPDVLNERPIFFRLYALLLAVAYAGLHRYRGWSSLVIPISKLPVTPSADAKVQDTHSLLPVQTRIQQRVIPALVESAVVSLVMMVVAPFIYGLFLRNIFWQIHLAIAKLFYNLSRANAHPTRYPLLGLPYLVRCIFAGFLLGLTWELTSNLLLVYLCQEPTKSGLPLSATSKDPNGTLLTGLKAKRDVVRTFAFWELTVIAQKHKDRRKAIFEDIERPTGPVWTQMLQAGLNVLQELQLRITGPPTAKPATPETVKPLPRLLPEVQTQSIFQADPKPSRTEWLASPLKQFGSSKQPWHPPIEQTAKQMETKLLEYAKPSGGDSKSSHGLIDSWTTELRRSRLGWFFTSTNAAKINATVLGSPYGNAPVLVDVIEALTKMQVASLTEDTYGKATPTVPDTVRTFTKTLNLVEDYVSQNKQGVAEGIEEVEIIIERLRASLKELLSAFQVYLIDQGLGIAELNQAKKAIQAPSTIPQSQEKPKSKSRPIEPRTERRLFQSDKQREGPKDRDTRRKDEILEVSGRKGGYEQSRTQDAGGPKESHERGPARIEAPPAWSLPRTTTSGPLFQRREMEQVR